MDAFALVIAVVGVVLGAVALWVCERRYRHLKKRFNFLQASTRNHHKMIEMAYRSIAEQRLAAEGRSPRLPLEFTSEFGEDIYLYELFGGKSSGFYIECGAYDGKQASVTYPFEAIGWTGLLVEPGPVAYEACKRHRPNSTVVHAALSKRNSTGHIEFVEVKSPTQEHSGTRSHVSTADTPKRIPGEDKLVRTRVPLMTMDDAVKFHSGRIDFAVIDVEGHEPELFDGFDLERLRPRALVVEEYPLGSRPELFNALRSRGYEVVGTIGWNRILVHRDEAELLQRARQLQLDLA